MREFQLFFGFEYPHAVALPWIESQYTLYRVGGPCLPLGSVVFQTTTFGLY
jgi:hypothetical protein